MYGNFFVEIKSEFSVPFQVGEEKAFVDVNNSNYISFKCCGIRTAMLHWSFIQFPFSLRVRGLEEDVVEGPQVSISESFLLSFLCGFPQTVLFQSSLPSQLRPCAFLPCFHSVAFHPSKSQFVFLIWYGCPCVSLIFSWRESWFLDLDWFFFFVFP